MNDENLIGRKVRITDNTMGVFHAGDIGVIIGHNDATDIYYIDFNNQGNAHVASGGKWAALRKRFELLEDENETPEAQSGGYLLTNGREYTTAEEVLAYLTGWKDAHKAQK
jgi:hypothetical protein